MLPVTRDHKKQIEAGQPRLRLGNQVPADGVGVAYTFVPALNPNENVNIVDLSQFILENAASDSESLLLMWPDESRLLRDAEEQPDVASQSFLLTSVFEQGQPLFYAHKLRYPIYDEAGPDDFGYYKGGSVVVKDLSGNALPPHLKYKVVLIEVDGNANYYTVYVYTSFKTDGIDNYRVQYSAVQLDISGSTPHIGYTEVLNPQAAFARQDQMETLIASENSPNFYLANSQEFGHSRIYVPRNPFPDTRTRVSFTYTIEAEGLGEVLTGVAEVLNPASVLPIELETYVNGSLVLVENVRQAALDLEMAITDQTVFTISSSNPLVRVMTRPDGNGPALATTRVRTGIITVPDQYKAILSGGDRLFNQTFAVKMTDHRQIRMLPPVETRATENWYLRVLNGRFRRQVADGTLGFFLPEYVRQDFDQTYGMPYRLVAAERPQIINDRRIRVRYTPLYVRTNADMEPENISVAVRDPLNPGSETIIPVSGWNVGDGTLELAGTVRDTDDIRVRYHYEESAVTYRGFWDGASGRYWHLDLNPGPGHTITLMGAGGDIKEVASYKLLDKSVYLYLRPAAKLTYDGGNYRIINGTFVRDSLFHTFEPYVAGIGEQEPLLLGKILVRPNSMKQSVQVRDTRVRGGGLRPEITEALMKELEPESKHYWDIGYWDGEPLHNQGVVVVRLSRQVLVDFGGRFTKSDVEEIVGKHIAWGVLSIIEYVDDDIVVERPERLVVKVIDVDVSEASALEQPRIQITIQEVAPGSF
jgi:hypothetical protein